MSSLRTDIVGVYTSSPGGRVVQRFCEELKRAGFETAVLSKDTAIESADLPSVIFSRFGDDDMLQHLHNLGIFEAAGCRVINGSRSWRTAANKAEAAPVFQAAGVPIPTTLVGISSFAECADQLGVPFVVKAPVGLPGLQVHLVSSSEEFDETVARYPGQTLLAQRYIRLKAPSDVRHFVVGDRWLAAMERQAPPGDFRTNTNFGGALRPYVATTAEQAAAVQAAQAVGAEIAGVDIMGGPEEPLVLEVNLSPGLKIEHITGRNLVEQIVRQTLARHDFNL